MPYQQQIARYLETDVSTRSREWLVPLLYEHLVKHLRRMELAIGKNDPALMAASATKASDILYELLGSLRVDAAPHIAKPLASLYTFLIAELLRIGRSRDARSLGRIITMCADLQDAWTKAAEQVAPRQGAPRLALV